MNDFKQFGLNATLINNLKKQHITTPTPIQNLTINHIINNFDVIAEAQTGTGKTLAFLLPMFQNFSNDSKHIQGLIITPTRELAIQITSEAKKLSENHNINILNLLQKKKILHLMKLIKK